MLKPSGCPDRIEPSLPRETQWGGNPWKLTSIYWAKQQYSRLRSYRHIKRCFILIYDTGNKAPSVAVINLFCSRGHGAPFPTAWALSSWAALDNTAKKKPNLKAVIPYCAVNHSLICEHLHTLHFSSTVTLTQLNTYAQPCDTHIQTMYK